MSTLTRPTTAVSSAPSTRTAMGEGMREVIPFVLGVLPLALAIGAMLAESSVSALAGWLAGPAIFGGAAQLLTIQMLDAGAAPAVIIVSAVLVNSRVLFYGAAIAPWFAEAGLRTRLLVAIPLIDPLFIQSQQRFARGDLDQRGRTAYYSGAAVVLVVAWMSVQAIALLVGGTLPDYLSLEMAAPLVFAGFLANLAKGRPALTAASVGGVIAVTGSFLPYQLSLSAGVVAGLVAGWVTLRLTTPSTAEES